MEEKRIGIFGGVFDPVHNGHLAIVEAALENFSLDSIYVIPCNVPAHKPQPIIPANERLKLLDVVFGDNERVVVSDIEIRRGGVSYTYETITAIRKVEGVRPYFFIGADNLSEIKTWKNPDKILSESQVVAIMRPGYDFIDKFPEYDNNILTMHIPLLYVSSTEVRKRLKMREDTGHLVPVPALDIIFKKSFYL